MSIEEFSVRVACKVGQTGNFWMQWRELIPIEGVTVLVRNQRFKFFAPY